MLDSLAKTCGDLFFVYSNIRIYGFCYVLILVYSNIRMYGFGYVLILAYSDLLMFRLPIPTRSLAQPMCICSHILIHT